MQKLCEDVPLPCTDEDYRDYTALVMFTASWCGPCKRMRPAFLELCRKMPEVTSDKCPVYICDVDQSAVHEDFDIASLPTFAFVTYGVENKALRVEGSDLVAVNASMVQHFGVGTETTTTST